MYSFTMLELKEKIKHEVNYPFLFEKVLIGLYLRLGATIKHHPDDFEDYLKAWHYWKDEE